MTERERLIELLTEAEDYWLKYVDDCAFNQVALSFTFEQLFADHLLANGVIVPPVMVQQEVYIVDGTTDGIVFGKITNLEYNAYTTPREWITVVGNYPFVGELREKNRIDLLLGKTVFLSREDAEKALKERSEGK